MGKHNELASIIGSFSRRAPFQRYLQASYSENTKMAYQADMRHFKKWGGKVPATADTVARYLAAHADKLAYATLSRRLVGIHREHLAKGLKSPVRTSLAQATLRGIGRTFSRKQRQVKPILKGHLLRMLAHMKGVQGARDRALLLVGFFGGFRRSELVGLDIGDIRFAKQGLMIRIGRSKTDQEGQGRDVPIPKVEGRLCAVKALTHWLRISGVKQGAIFRRVTRHGTVGRSRLSARAVATIVKSYIEKIGLAGSEYAGHSLRAGLVTSAAMAGAAAWQIKKQTGHKSDATVARYIRAQELFSVNVGKMVV